MLNTQSDDFGVEPAKRIFPSNFDSQRQWSQAALKGAKTKKIKYAKIVRCIVGKF
jgi:hypothetical protein